jgi:hypothetical protein
MKQILSIIVLFITTLSIAQNMSIETKKVESKTVQEIMSSDTYYNLGIDYYHKKEIGKAIWAFETALKVDPSNIDAVHNLKFIRSEYSEINSNTTKGIGNWLGQNIYSQTPNLWFYVSIITSIIIALCIFIFFIPTSRKTNNISLTIGSLFGFVMLMSVIFSIMQKNNLTNNNNAVIINPRTNILTQPLLNSETINQITEGNQLLIINSQDDWYELKINNETGWVIKDSVWVY